MLTNSLKKPEVTKSEDVFTFKSIAESIRNKFLRFESTADTKNQSNESDDDEPENEIKVK